MLTGVIVVVVLSLVVGVPRLLRQTARQKKLRKIAVAKIGTLAPGPHIVRVVGTARAVGAATTAGPYSGTPGVAAVFERWDSQRIQRLDRQVRHVPFVVEDETGSVQIALEHADFALELLPVKLAETGPNRVFGAGIIAANREAAGDTLECVVKPGDRLAVVGYVYARPDGLVLAGTAASPVVVSNDPVLLAS
ncbi:MAG TPA: GIDE domain-containing protein [Kofleriaceae bacterium]